MSCSEIIISSVVYCHGYKFVCNQNQFYCQGWVMTSSTTEAAAAGKAGQTQLPCCLYESRQAQTFLSLPPPAYRCHIYPNKHHWVKHSQGVSILIPRIPNIVLTSLTHPCRLKSPSGFMLFFSYDCIFCCFLQHQNQSINK